MEEKGICALADAVIRASKLKQSRGLQDLLRLRCKCSPIYLHERLLFGAQFKGGRIAGGGVDNILKIDKTGGGGGGHNKKKGGVDVLEKRGGPQPGGGEL